MVQQGEGHGGGASADGVGVADVGAAGPGIAARVVVDEDEGGRALVQGGADDLLEVEDRLVAAAAAGAELAEQILVVQASPRPHPSSAVSSRMQEAPHGPDGNYLSLPPS